MASDPQSIERLYRQTLYDIHQYIDYYYACNTESVPGPIVNTLQAFDDLRSLPFSKTNFRLALHEGAKLIADHNLALGEDDKERTHILASLADLGFFLEDDIVYADFVL